MKERREILIENRVFQKEDILRLVRAIHQDYSPPKNEQSYRVYFSLLIKCEDGSSFEIEDLALLDNDCVIDYKDANSIECDLRDSAEDKSLRLSLSRNNSTGSLAIASRKKEWVRDRFVAFQEIIDSIAPQSTFFRRYKTVLLLVISLLIGYLFVFFLNKLFALLPRIELPPSDLATLARKIPFLDFVFIMFYSGCLGYPIADMLRNKMLALWPSIEFHFGPEHQRVIAKRKRIVMVYCFLLAVPIIINLFSSYLYGLLVK